MKPTLFAGLTVLAAVSALQPPVASADPTCKPRLIEKDTKFPLGAQLLGQEGTVYLNVIVAENGRALRADLQHSSGYRKLDRAASRSAVDNWVFDVSACERKDLPVTQVVVVEYHNDSY